MLDRLRNLFGARASAADDAQLAEPPAGSGRVWFEDREFDVMRGARTEDGIPHPDWDSARAWVLRFPEAQLAGAWLACERAWLDNLRGSIGLEYRLHESDTALLLTSQGARMASVKLGYLGTTLRRIERVLEEIVDSAHIGKQILIAFDKEDDYYRYVSGFYPDKGDFAMSSGMHLNFGCSHFVTHGLEIDRIEPVIVHEMTHSCLAHLPIPAWLNEGMAVTVEHMFAPRGQEPNHAQELLKKHRAFWTPELMQEFWSGAAFHRTDDGNELSYDLGRILVDGLSSDWSTFKAFVREATLKDSGAAAAAHHFEVDLGEFVRLFLQRPEGAWAPQASTWEAEPERGAF